MNFITSPVQYCYQCVDKAFASGGQRSHRLAGVPSEHLAALLLMDRHVAVEVDGVAHVQALDLPGVAEVQPVIRLLVLESVHYGLREHSHHKSDMASVCFKHAPALV